MHKYRVMFDNEAETFVQADTAKKAFHKAKKKLIGEYKKSNDEEFKKKWLDSMSLQHLGTSRVEMIE